LNYPLKGVDCINQSVPEFLVNTLPPLALCTQISG
jgi:hypothetical protein